MKTPTPDGLGIPHTAYFSLRPPRQPPAVGLLPCQATAIDREGAHVALQVADELLVVVRAVLSGGRPRRGVAREALCKGAHPRWLAHVEHVSGMCVVKEVCILQHAQLERCPHTAGSERPCRMSCATSSWIFKHTSRQPRDTKYMHVAGSPCEQWRGCQVEWGYRWPSR